MTNSTITQAFLDTVEAHPELTALRWKEGRNWQQMTWGEMADRVARFAGGLQARGVERGDRVALLTSNRPEFHIADLATLFCGAVPVSLYSSSSPSQVVELTERLDARLLLTNDDITSVDGEPVDLVAAAALVSPTDLATIIFTSGTTSQSKGVLLTHANVAAMVESVQQLNDVDFTAKRVVSYLPLAHVAERLLSHYLPVHTAMAVTTCPSPAYLSSYLTDTRPHLFFGVPRIWEKLQSGVEHELAKSKVTRLAVKVAMSNPVGRLVGRKILDRMRAQLGLDQVVLAASGAAPLSASTAKWLTDLGIPFSEIYGMSESTGPITWSPRGHRVGTVGRPAPGVEVRLLPDGEVICRGESIFGGYLDDDTSTAAALHDGWLCTGDIGKFDSDGNLCIVDRKKDLIITSGGKNVSPAMLEAKVEAHPAVAAVCIVGDRRPFVSAVVSVDVALTDEVRASIDRHVAAVNATVSQAERIKKVIVVDECWVPGSDVLTHTLKIRRKGVEARYADQLASIYNGVASKVAA